MFFISPHRNYSWVRGVKPPNFLQAAALLTQKIPILHAILQKTMKSYFPTSILFALGLLPVGVSAAAETKTLSSTDAAAWNLTSSHAATDWKNSYPVGNGSLGAMNLGAFPKETIYLNNDTIWSGRAPVPLAPNSRKADMDAAFQLALKGDYAGAQALFCKAKNMGNGISGFQGLGTLTITHEELASPGGLDLSDGWKRGPETLGRDFAKESTASAFNDNAWTVANDEKDRQLKPDSVVVFRKHLTLSKAQLKAMDTQFFQIESGGEDWGSVYVNDRKVGDSAGYAKETLLDLKGILKEGDNVIAVVVGNTAGGGWLAKEVKLKTGKQPACVRRLDLLTGESAAATTLEDGVITETVLASYPDQCVAIRLTSTRPNGLNCRLALGRAQGVTRQTAEGNDLFYEGQTNALGTKFAVRARVLPESGGAVKADGNTLILAGGKAATILITSATDYHRENPRAPRTDDWSVEGQQRITKAAALGYEKLRASAAADHTRLMKACVLDVGTTEAVVAKLTTPERLELLKAGGSDPDLLESFFQLGRHMLIGSSRPGSLPPNLQGLWEGGMSAAWAGDFHLNINVQMNMWPASLTGLEECNEPYFHLLKLIHRHGQETAASLGCRGYNACLNTDGWGMSDFAGGSPEWDSYVLGGHWAQEHLMESYRFTQDHKFLKEKAWPILKDGSLFLLDWMRENPENDLLIAGPSSSPENAFRYTTPDGKKAGANIAIGNTHDHAVAWETFSDTLEAAKILGISDDFTAQVAKALKRVPAPPIGEDGRLMEWYKPFAEVWTGHRHKSHLYGLYPGHQITLSGTPALAEAARKSLEVRMAPGGGDAGGGGRTGWNLAWSINLWARLHEGDKALALITEQINRQTYENLFNRCGGPFQIDGNLGTPAGMVEMLIQSHETTADGKPLIRLLPALPAAWTTGSAKGLHARGGVTVDMAWKNGKVTNYRVTSNQAQKATVLVNGETKQVATEKN
jgi:alpha-L-fucosidase 2